MARYQIPLAVKVAFWAVYLALFFLFTLSPLYMGPVDPPVP